MERRVKACAFPEKVFGKYIYLWTNHYSKSPISKPLNSKGKKSNHILDQVAIQCTKQIRKVASPKLENTISCIIKQNLKSFTEFNLKQDRNGDYWQC